MAYSPTTWNTNDVITKDKLNKIEQGIETATLLSGTDIDADKDWNGKNITNVGQLQANSVTTTTVTLIPDICIWYQDNETKTTNSTSFTTLKTANAVPAGVSGTVAVYYDIDTSDAAPGGRAELRKNGSTVRSHYVTYSEKYWEGRELVAVAPGDVISLAFSTLDSEMLVKNNRFEIRAIPMPGPVSIAPW